MCPLILGCGSKSTGRFVVANEKLVQIWQGFFLDRCQKWASGGRPQGRAEGGNASSSSSPTTDDDAHRHRLSTTKNKKHFLNIDIARANIPRNLEKQQATRTSFAVDCVNTQRVHQPRGERNCRGASRSSSNTVEVCNVEPRNVKFYHLQLLIILLSHLIAITSWMTMQ